MTIFFYQQIRYCSDKQVRVGVIGEFDGDCCVFCEIKIEDSCG